MTKNKEELFQERVDELLLMEQRIDKRTKKLVEYNETMRREISNATSNLFKTTTEFEKEVDLKLKQLEKISDEAHDNSTILLTLWKNLSIAFVVIAVIILIGIGAGTWRLNYLLRRMDTAKLTLESLNEKLSKTPTVIKFLGREYIRIEKHSTMNFNESFKTIEKDKYGAYAEVWYNKEK